MNTTTARPTQAAAPTAPADRAAPGSRFTPEEIARYRSEGYLIVPGLFTAGEVARAHEAIAQITHEAVRAGRTAEVLELEPETVNGEAVARRIYHPFLAHEVFREMACDARMLDRIEDLIGPDLCCNLSKLNMKPARVGSVVDWHQDLAYYPHTNADLVTVLVYLDDATVENGCLQVLPRHQHAYFSHSDREGNFAGLITEDLDSGRYGRPVPLEGKAGSVIFMHCVLPHSSLPNRSAHPRRTLIYSYRAADAHPIYYGASVVAFEQRVRQVRGRPSLTARFGGPPPLVPRTDTEMQSLYEMQRKARNGRGQGRGARGEKKDEG